MDSVYEDQKYEVLETHPDLSGGVFDWHYLSVRGWVREDYAVLDVPGNPVGQSGSINVPVPPSAAVHKFTLPCPGTFTGGWNAYGGTHKGWDVANTIGTRIYGQRGGVVQQKEWCVKCGTDGKSSYNNGVPLYQIYRDREWNGGWGHYIVLRYAPFTLPGDVQAMFPGQHAYVLYGHLSDFLANVGDLMRDNLTPIALMGNSGNSSGPHVHIEVRFSDKDNLMWSQLGQSVDPGVLFSR